MNTLDTNKEAPGMINNFDKMTRVVIGLSALVSLLGLGVTDNIAYPYLMLLATIIVLSGIAGWDPLYAVKDAIFGRKSKLSFPMGSTAQSAA